jgi:hypothetical protein
MTRRIIAECLFCSTEIKEKCVPSPWLHAFSFESNSADEDEKYL